MLQLQTNYRGQAVRRILADAGVYGKKVQQETLWNCLINNKGGIIRGICFGNNITGKSPLILMLRACLIILPIKDLT